MGQRDRSVSSPSIEKPRPYAHTGGQIIAVSIQYRVRPYTSTPSTLCLTPELSLLSQLGLLGFLASETLMNDGTANAGLLDQRASFEWLQRHVASFGGDPNKITISVSHLDTHRHNGAARLTCLM